MLTALRKQDGGVRGIIVVGDVMRRLVARTTAKQVSKKVEEATGPFQHALTTKAGCECVAHILHTITDLDNRATVVSIDGVGAYDLISRNAMMEGLLRMEQGDQILPFVRCFYGSPSTYLWEDETGNVQDIPQGEGGEQGDPLMPLLFALGLHGAFSAVKARFREGEKVFAFLDDVYVTCAPERVLDVYKILEEEIFAHTHIRMHHGKTQVWNRGSVIPQGVETLTRVAQLTRPGAVVWKGDDGLPLSQQGIKILGIPVGQPEYVRQFLEEKADEHRTLFQRIPMVEDPQAAWLLLFMCASTRANFWLRGVQPEWTSIFAETHDANVWECLRQILNCHGGGSAQVTASLPFFQGGLGLTSAVRIREGAHWASWADCLKMVRQRHPAVADTMVSGLAEGLVRCFEAVRRCALSLSDAGFEPPSWTELAAAKRSSSQKIQSPTNPRWVGNREPPSACTRSSWMITIG